MGRRNVVKLSTLDVNVPGYGPLAIAIENLRDAEDDFYNAREDQLDRYPGLSVTARSVEKEYDKLYGNDPWNYSSRGGSSSNERTESDSTTDVDGNDQDLVYVQIPYDRKDDEILEGITGTTQAFDDPDAHYLHYNPGVGVLAIDITFENISFFKKGSTSAFEIQDGFSETFQTGFGEVPVFYNGNSNYSGKQLHMFSKLGAIYDSIVAPKYTAYTSALNTYNNNNGTVTTNPILRDPFKEAWDNFQGDETGYNRPEKLERKLRREAMGFN